MTPQEALEKILSVFKSSKKSGDKTAKEYLAENIGNIGAKSRSYQERLIALAEGIEEYAKWLPDDFEKKSLVIKVVSNRGVSPENIRAMTLVANELASYFKKDCFFSGNYFEDIIFCSVRYSSPERIALATKTFGEVMKFYEPKNALRCFTLLIQLIKDKPIEQSEVLNKVVSVEIVGRLFQGLSLIEPSKAICERLRKNKPEIETLELIAEVASQRRKPEPEKALSEQKSK